VVRATQPADIYSAAIVLKEVMCKNEAYEEEIHVKGMTPKGRGFNPEET
jgi:hypothetical protein